MFLGNFVFPLSIDFVSGIELYTTEVLLHSSHTVDEVHSYVVWFA